MAPNNIVDTDTVLSDIACDDAKDLNSLLEDFDNPLLNNCKYCLPEEVNTLSFNKAKLKLLHLNIHSLPNKIDSLMSLLDCLNNKDYEIDLISLCETFINDYNVSRCNIPNYNFEEIHRKEMSRGGVGIYINKNLKYKLRPDLSVFDEGYFESIFLEITTGNKHTVVGEIYRVPNTNEANFIENYQTIVEQINAENKDIVIGTDQNLDYLKYDKHSNTEKLLNFNLASGLLPTISKPTRITHSTATLIDNIYVKSKHVYKSKSAILTTDISDHFPCMLVIENDCNKNKEPLQFEQRKFTSNAIECIKTDLEQKDWNVLNGQGVNESYNTLVTSINESLDKHAPLKKVTIPAKYVINEPWMTKGLIKSSSTCDKLFSKVVGLDKDSEKYTKYKQYRNLYNSLKRKAKVKYFRDKIEEHFYNSRKLWRTLNILIGKCNDKSCISDSFIIEGMLSSDPDKISNGFCNYFANVGKSLASKIPIINKSATSYISRDVQHSLFLSPTDRIEISDIISKIKNKTSSGYDHLSNALIKEIHNQITEPLTTIVNKSLEAGYVPNEMKIAKIIPVFKSKEKVHFSNYRPISLLPTLSKILEKVVYKRLYKFLLQNNILFNSQYGFRSGHSTSDAVAELVSSILFGFDNKEMTLAVFLDLSKAFDTVDHKILLDKLERYGIRGTALDWFRSYLSDRKQFVQYKTARSSASDIEYGVPQGSVLGPLLFIIYINDLNNCLDLCKAILFADDSTVYITGKNKKLLFFQMKKELLSLIEWFQVNKLSLNLIKTNYTLFTPKNSSINDANESFTLTFGSETIKEVNNVKFLGLQMDRHLDWSEHFKILHRRLSRANFILSQVKNILPKTCMKMLYYSLFQSHINYGLYVWGTGMLSCNLKKIATAQKKAVRSVAKKSYNSHTDPLFVDLNILKFTDVVDIELMKLMYNHSKNLLPIPIQSLFTINRDIHHYNTRHRNDPVVISRHYAPLDRSFLCRAPLLWSALDPSIKACRTINSFKYNIKKSKIRLY